MQSREIIDNLHKDVISSYSVNELGISIYEYVIKKKPNTVIELGTLHGYSAICIGLALKDNGFGKLTCYDLWDDYEFTHTSLDKTLKTIKQFGLDDIITVKSGDALEWCKSPDDFDLLHLDISNDGDKIKTVYHLLQDKVESGSDILFEGGTRERDETTWIKKYGFTPIYSVKDEVGYHILDERYPGLSLITSGEIR
tara:strand:+ start:27488 stop:28078 length:591 start_codon:yes stop_codon:yes gene_type:complete